VYFGPFVLILPVDGEPELCGSLVINANRKKTTKIKKE
jgi:hypothetical protein